MFSILSTRIFFLNHFRLLNYFNTFNSLEDKFVRRWKYYVIFDSIWIYPRSKQGIFSVCLFQLFCVIISIIYHFRIPTRDGTHFASRRRRTFYKIDIEERYFQVYLRFFNLLLAPPSPPPPSIRLLFIHSKSPLSITSSPANFISI